MSGRIEVQPPAARVVAAEFGFEPTEEDLAIGRDDGRCARVVADARGCAGAGVEPRSCPQGERASEVGRRLAHDSALQINEPLHFLQSEFMETEPSLHSVRMGSTFFAGRRAAALGAAGGVVVASDDLACT